MLYAVISDIHGNYPALQAVLEDAEKAGAQGYIFAGDYITDQPYTAEIIQTLRRLPGAVLVSGNRERYMGHLDPAERRREQAVLLHLTEDALQEEGLRWVQALPPSLLLDAPGGKKLLVEHICEEINGKLHAGRGSRKLSCGTLNSEFAGQNATHEEVAEFARSMLAANPALGALKERAGADVVIHGHNHLQYTVEMDGVVYLNPGSCGLPGDHQGGAPYTLLRCEPESLSWEERRVAYDVQETVERYRRSAFYRASPVWCEMVIHLLLTGRDDFRTLFHFLTEENQRLAPQSDGEFNTAFRSAFRKTREQAGF